MVDILVYYLSQSVQKPQSYDLNCRLKNRKLWIYFEKGRMAMIWYGVSLPVHSLAPVVDVDRPSGQGLQCCS